MSTRARRRWLSICAADARVLSSRPDRFIFGARMSSKPSALASALLLATILTTPGPIRAAGGREFLPPGFRPLPLGVHALVGGKVVIKPGEVLDGATIVIRDGYIEAVGKNVSAPADARVWDAKGLTIYAGFIEPYLTLGATNPPVSTTDSEPVNSTTLASGGANFFGVPGQKTDMGQRGPGYGVGKVVPETRAGRDYSPEKKMIEPLRELGFTTAVVAPVRGIVRRIIPH